MLFVHFVHFGCSSYLPCSTVCRSVNFSFNFGQFNSFALLSIVNFIFNLWFGLGSEIFLFSMHILNAINFLFAINIVKCLLHLAMCCIDQLKKKNSTLCHSFLIDYQFQMSHAFKLCLQFPFISVYSSFWQFLCEVKKCGRHVFQKCGLLHTEEQEERAWEH